MLPDNPIDGLRMAKSGSLRSCGECRALSHISARPLNVIFHGHEDHFEYDTYGIHRGTEDRLTFAGPPDKEFRADFIDCRAGSPSWGRRYTVRLQPSLERTLVIPPGVAHTFSGLEGILTINSFRNFLPDPNEWISGKSSWSIAVDTINLPCDVEDCDVPSVEANRLEASDQFYAITSASIKRTLDGVLYEYPLTSEIKFGDGTKRLLRFKKASVARSPLPAYEAIPGIEGAGWERRIVVTGDSGAQSGYTIMPSPNHIDFIEMEQASGASVSDRLELESCETSRSLTFFGDSRINVQVRLAHRGGVKDIELSPSPMRDLVIPPHVAVAIGTEGPLLLAVKHGSSGQAGLVHQVDRPAVQSYSAVGR